MVDDRLGEAHSYTLSRVCRCHAGYVALIRVCCQVSDDVYVRILLAPWSASTRCAQADSMQDNENVEQTDDDVRGSPLKASKHSRELRLCYRDKRKILSDVMKLYVYGRARPG